MAPTLDCVRGGCANVGGNAGRWRNGTGSTDGVMVERGQRGRCEALGARRARGAHLACRLARCPRPGPPPTPREGRGRCARPAAKVRTRWERGERGKPHQGSPNEWDAGWIVRMQGNTNRRRRQMEERARRKEKWQAHKRGKVSMYERE
eukprot:6172152-Pleurochrysis_carterae.AAC.1